MSLVRVQLGEPNFDTEQEANAFLAADELKEAMAALGVAKAPKLQVFNTLV